MAGSRKRKKHSIKLDKSTITAIGAIFLSIVGICALAALSVLGILIARWSEAPYQNPPVTLQETDLVGTWEVNYGGWGTDQLILNRAGTFQQIYKDHDREGYIYIINGDEWWIEQFPDGRARLHLPSARYYKEGIELAEMDGIDESLCPKRNPTCWGGKLPPYPFHDPIAGDFVDMVGELVLNIRIDSSGELLLLHMWASSEDGFPVIGDGGQIFRRVEEP